MVQACFFLASDFGSTVSGIEVGEACEEVVGENTIDGAQRLGGLCRIYPKSIEGKRKLMVQGITIRGNFVPIMDRNPFIIGNYDGPTTKITIGNIALSVSNEERVKGLKNIKGLTLVSQIYDECYRRENGKLTTWKTGRRYAYILHPLSTVFSVGPWKPTLYHFGKKKKKGFQSSEEASKETPPERSIPVMEENETVEEDISENSTKRGTLEEKKKGTKQKVLTDMLSSKHSRSRTRTGRSQTPNSRSSIKRLGSENIPSPSGKMPKQREKASDAPDTDVDYFDFTPAQHITPEAGQE